MKKYFMISIIIFFPLVIIGCMVRGTFVNANDLSYYTVATADVQILDILERNIDDIEERSEYIMKVRCKSSSQFVFKKTYQEVEVLKVFRGDSDVKKGDKINISPASSCIFTDDGSINMGFINEMRIEEEYLVFLDEPKSSIELGISIYPTVEFIMTMIFAYDDIETSIAQKGYVPYTDVKAYEIFADSQSVIDKFLKIKENLLEKYKAD